MAGSVLYSLPIDDDEIALLRENERRIRMYRRKLMSHPDCRDPDHPGCENCEGDGEDEQETD